MRGIGVFRHGVSVFPPFHRVFPHPDMRIQSVLFHRFLETTTSAVSAPQTRD
ncbi:MAG: hypothetical protein Q4C53_02940 [Clostridia bacterium]|nr:hypothetical protein [Clostridia bacterium]